MEDKAAIHAVKAPSEQANPDHHTQHTIVPQKGEMTNWLNNVFGEEPTDDADALDRQVAKIIDGVKAANPEYDMNIRGFFNALAPETILAEKAPTVGLKIHVALDPDSEDFIDQVKQIAQVCMQKNEDNKATTFKVMLISVHKNESNPDQARKIVTIYPNYLGGAKTNVAETVRIIAGLREITKNDATNGTENGIHSEHQAGNRIYVRAGSFTSAGDKYETVRKDQPFEEQVAGNLTSPETDGALFAQQITEAIKNGSL